VGYTNKIRILLADDHESVIERACLLLGDDFEIVGTVSNGRDAISEVENLDPDVLVIDISMPILNGLQAVSLLRLAQKRTKVVFLTVHDDQDYVTAAFAAGASGYVTKPNLTSDLIPAIQAAAEGRTYVSASVPP